MANPETNPFKNLGIDPGTIKAIEAAGGVEAVKRFIDGYKRAASRDLHPDKTPSPTAHEKLLAINKGTAAITDSPDMLVSQWVKGIRSKPKAPIAIPQLQTTKPNQVLNSLIATNASKHQFWMPAKYIVQTTVKYEGSIEKVHSSRQRVISNDGVNLSYQNAFDVSENITGHSPKKAIIKDIDRAKKHSTLTDIMQSEAVFLDMNNSSLARKALLEVGSDGSSTLSDKKSTKSFHNVVGEDSEEIFSKAGFYGLVLNSTEWVEKRLADLGLSAVAGPALATTFPSVELVSEPKPFEGLIIGFIGMDYLDALARSRQEVFVGSKDQIVNELLPGQAQIPNGSVRLRDEELPILEEFYLSELDVSSYKSRDAELLVSRSGQATLMGSITKVIPQR